MPQGAIAVVVVVVVVAVVVVAAVDLLCIELYSQRVREHMWSISAIDNT